MSYEEVRKGKIGILGALIAFAGSMPFIFSILPITPSWILILSTLITISGLVIGLKSKFLILLTSSIIAFPALMKVLFGVYWLMGYSIMILIASLGKFCEAKMLITTIRDREEKRALKITVKTVMMSIWVIIILGLSFYGILTESKMFIELLGILGIVCVSLLVIGATCAAEDAMKKSLPFYVAYRQWFIDAVTALFFG